jgi:serine/threonine-protein kinase
MTKTADVMGSPLYMSPEQMASARDVDLTTDIWALGVILFQLITGKPPFPAATMPELVLRIATSAPEPLRHVIPDAPPGLERVILRCLEKDRTKRYRNVAELAWALIEFGPPRARASAERIARIVQTSGQPTSELVPPPSPAPTPQPRAEETLDAWGKTSPKRTQRKWAVAVVSLGLLAAAVVSLVHFLSKAPTAETKSAAEPASSPERAGGPPKLEIIETPPPTVSPAHAAPVVHPNATTQPEEEASVPALDIGKTIPNTPAPTTRRTRPATTATPAPRSVSVPPPAVPPTLTAPPVRNVYDSRK